MTLCDTISLVNVVKTTDADGLVNHYLAGTLTVKDV